MGSTCQNVGFVYVSPLVSCYISEYQRCHATEAQQTFIEDTMFKGKPRWKDNWFRWQVMDYSSRPSNKILVGYRSERIDKKTQVKVQVVSLDLNL